MIYLSKITLGNNRSENWPFNISIIKNLNELILIHLSHLLQGEMVQVNLH